MYIYTCIYICILHEVHVMPPPIENVFGPAPRRSLFRGFTVTVHPFSAS